MKRIADIEEQIKNLVAEIEELGSQVSQFIWRINVAI